MHEAMFLDFFPGRDNPDLLDGFSSASDLFDFATDQMLDFFRRAWPSDKDARSDLLFKVETFTGGVGKMIRQTDQFFNFLFLLSAFPGTRR